MAGPSHDPSLYRDRDVVPVRRALVSVSDKSELLTLATALAEAGVRGPFWRKIPRRHRVDRRDHP